MRARPGAARAWAMDYLRKGNVPTHRGNTFAKFATDVGILKEDAKPKGELTQKEATKLLDERTIDKVWDGSYYNYVLNLTAAHTGMRLGEVLGLTPAAIKKGELEVKHSRNGTEFGLGDTKTHESRQVPIPKEVEDHLRALVVKRTDPGRWDLVFAYREDGAPLSDKRIGAKLYEALTRISITEEERDRRNITFHSRRAFFNTAALNAVVNENLVRKITGHKTAQMTNHYTRPNVADMTTITELQKNLVKPKK